MTQMMTLKLYEVWAKKVAKLVKLEIFDITEKFHFRQVCAKKFHLLYGIIKDPYGPINGGMN